MTTTKRAKTPTNAPTMTVETVIGEYGIPQPSIWMDLGERSDYRAVSAAMHRIAARIELLSGAEKWCVQTRANHSFENKGRVYLELARADAAECERGLAVLRTVVAQGAADVAALRVGR